MADEQTPLVDEIQFYEENEDTVLQDISLYPLKPFTYIIVKGKARNPKLVIDLANRLRTDDLI